MPQDAKTYDLLIVGPADTEKYFVCIKKQFTFAYRFEIPQQTNNTTP